MSETVAVNAYDAETPWPQPRTFQDKPYLTRVAVAGDRLSDLIDALKQFDPDTRIRTSELNIQVNDVDWGNSQTRRIWAFTAAGRVAL